MIKMNIINKYLLVALISTISNTLCINININLRTKQHKNGYTSYLWIVNIDKNNNQTLSKDLSITAYDSNINHNTLPDIISELVGKIAYKISILDEQISLINPKTNKTISPEEKKQEINSIKIADSIEQNKIETFSWEESLKTLVEKVKLTEKEELIYDTHRLIITGENISEPKDLSIITEETIKIFNSYREIDTLKIEVKEEKTIENYIRLLPEKIIPQIREFKTSTMATIETIFRLTREKRNKTYIDIAKTNLIVSLLQGSPELEDQHLKEMSFTQEEIDCARKKATTIEKTKPYDNLNHEIFQNNVFGTIPKTESFEAIHQSFKKQTNKKENFFPNFNLQNLDTPNFKDIKKDDKTKNLKDFEEFFHLEKIKIQGKATKSILRKSKKKKKKNSTNKSLNKK